MSMKCHKENKKDTDHSMFFDTVALSSDEDGTRAGTPRGGEFEQLEAERTLGNLQQNPEPTSLTSLRPQ
ncbi:hypothetical protein NPIL_127291 [Nephila pilipes]|uniref:Uncharacterized protein n=1 Tax=Nephila pilipes TaxID=299642 RepID=A0A8X6MJ77_NEPPI|nr:hypothetical protein NPIL_127291 [Nephila pilipes]